MLVAQKPALWSTAELTWPVWDSVLRMPVVRRSVRQRLAGLGCAVSMCVLAQRAEQPRQALVTARRMPAARQLAVRQPEWLVCAVPMRVEQPHVRWISHQLMHAVPMLAA